MFIDQDNLIIEIGNSRIRCKGEDEFTVLHGFLFDRGRCLIEEGSVDDWSEGNVNLDSVLRGADVDDKAIYEAGKHDDTARQP